MTLIVIKPMKIKKFVHGDDYENQPRSLVQI